MHGSNADRAILSATARRFLSLGYDVLVFDLRACGESDGDRQTFGAYERMDVLGAYDYMKARGYAPSHMTVLGLRSGGAAMIEAARDMGDVAALIADSSPARLAVTVERYWDSLGVSRFMAWSALQATRFYGVDPGLMPSREVHSLSDRAFLFFHAEGDQSVPVSEARELKNASMNPATQLVITPDGYHSASFGADPDQYLAIAQGFIDQQIRTHTAAGAG